VTAGGGAKVDLLRLLSARAGQFRGGGADADGAQFGAALTVSAVAGGAAVALTVTETDPAGRSRYGEHGVLAAGEDGTLRYCAVSSGAPFHRVFALRRTGSADGRALAVFGWGGPPELTAGFREEVTLLVYADGDIGLGWAYGVPGEPFAPRSAARLSPAPPLGDQGAIVVS